MTTRIHISLAVADLQESIEFYRTMFATGPTKQRPDYANFRLLEPPIHLALVSSQTSSVRFAGHLGVELPDHETLDQWRARGKDDPAVLDEPDAQCCYARGDKFWLSDPDGHRWEVWVRTGDYDDIAPPAGKVSGADHGSQANGGQCGCSHRGQ